MGTPAHIFLQKENSNLFMDIPWDVDKALEVLQESGKLRMENIKKGGNSFGRELQEEPLKIFTHCKQIPGAMEG